MITLKAKNFELNDIELIIFDKDGTITDSHYFWQEIINRRAKKICKKLSLHNDFEKKIESIMGLNPETRKLKSSGPIAIKSRNEVIYILNNFLKENDIKTDKEILESTFSEVHKEFEKDAHEFVKPISSCVDFINKLDKKKVKIVLITSDSTINANIAMKKLSLLNRFELVIGNDKKLGEKKDGFPAVFACRKININPINTIVIGDTMMDYQMALNAKIKSSILISSGQVKLDELRNITPYSLSSLDELLIQ